MVFKPQVVVVGLGYVGLPVAVAFGRSGIKTIGFDISSKKIKLLTQGEDPAGELSHEELAAATELTFTDNPLDLKKANFIIVAVPTPVTKANKPDLSLIESASELVGKNMAKGATVVFESTVYPGVTEDICAPILEKTSGLKLGTDFHIGYSPERINPGDKEHTLEKIVKVVAGQDSASAEVIADVYRVVCHAGVHIAPNIKTAEAAKVIENTQRDLNIALINELSLIFHRIGINTYDVLEAAGTKWNFLKFTPGLVGGHCIGVDPYYLVHKAEELGYHPQVIAAGRRVNDYMPEFVADETVKGLIKAGKIIQQSNVLILGLTFKENVSDIRNSRISVTIARLKSLGISVVAYDPFLEEDEVKQEFDGLELITHPTNKYDAIIINTPHDVLLENRVAIKQLIQPDTTVVDIKNKFPELKPHSIYKSL